MNNRTGKPIVFLNGVLVVLLIGLIPEQVFACNRWIVPGYTVLSGEPEGRLIDTDVYFMDLTLEVKPE